MESMDLDALSVLRIGRYLWGDQSISIALVWHHRRSSFKSKTDLGSFRLSHAMLDACPQWTKYGEELSRVEIPRTRLSTAAILINMTEGIICKSLEDYVYRQQPYDNNIAWPSHSTENDQRLNRPLLSSPELAWLRLSITQGRRKWEATFLLMYLTGDKTPGIILPGLDWDSICDSSAPSDSPDRDDSFIEIANILLT